MNKIHANGFTRITKTEARKRWNEGKLVHLFASKMAPGSMWVGRGYTTTHHNYDEAFGTTFDTVCGEFMYYNCNAETGKDIYFYIKDGE